MYFFYNFISVFGLSQRLNEDKSLKSTTVTGVLKYTAKNRLTYALTTVYYITHKGVGANYPTASNKPSRIFPRNKPPRTL